MKNKKTTNAITTSLSKWMEKHVRPVTDHLNKQVNNKSVRSRKIGLVFFGVMISVTCYWLIAQSTGLSLMPSFKSDTLKVEIPQHLLPTAEESIETEREIIKQFNHYVDSLNIVDSLSTQN